MVAENYCAFFITLSLGKKFHYTTHAWTLISAVIESASGKTFLDYMNENIFQPLGMTSTFPEVHTTLLYGRSRLASSHTLHDQQTLQLKHAVQVHPQYWSIHSHLVYCTLTRVACKWAREEWGGGVNEYILTTSNLKKGPRHFYH